ncbi:hypothetical protein T265_14766, partial [Opisthorchis viverrini]
LSRRKQQDLNTTRLSKPRQEQSGYRGWVRTTNLPVDFSINNTECEKTAVDKHHLSHCVDTHSLPSNIRVRTKCVYTRRFNTTNGCQYVSGRSAS